MSLRTETLKHFRSLTKEVQSQVDVVKRLGMFPGDDVIPLLEENLKYLLDKIDREMANEISLHSARRGSEGSSVFHEPGRCE